jgi:hypothetical protein
MNTYDLEIIIDQSYIDQPKIYHLHVDCEENVLKDHLSKISNQGFLIDVGYDRRYIPGYKINYIDVKILERVQVISDVTESIKEALTEK